MWRIPHGHLNTNFSFSVLAMKFILKIASAFIYSTNQRRILIVTRNKHHYRPPLSKTHCRIFLDIRYRISFWREKKNTPSHNFHIL